MSSEFECAMKDLQKALHSNAAGLDRHFPHLAPSVNGPVSDANEEATQ